MRENSEYKFAQERRARLQAELKMLSEQLNKARIITSEDISLDKVGIGAKVTLKVNDKDEVVYTILGPWDANPDVNILSNNSKLAQAMIDKSVGDKFEFKSDIFLISNIKSYI